MPGFTHSIRDTAMNRILCLVGKQAGKEMYTSVWKGNDILNALKSGVVTVNADAQRTLAKGASTTPTHKLMDQDKVHDTPRMKAFVQFLNRVLDKVERKDVSEGFLGAVLMTIPEDFTDARWESMDGLPKEAQHKVGFLVVEDAGVGRPAFHLGDGQGRFFGLYSMEFATKKKIEAVEKGIEKGKKVKSDVRELEKQLKGLKDTLQRVQKFLRELHLTVVCYARARRDDDTIVGLDVKAQQRLFVEGNALNSRSSKEAQLSFDTVSPVGNSLSEVRFQPEFAWMGPDFIEGNSKSIAKGSSKLFTLSALTQAYGWSVANTTKVQRLDADMYEMVGERQEFAWAYWRKVGEVFAPLWQRPEDADDGAWLDHLLRRRAEQNVALQAVFLQALGKFGYNLGKLAGWNPDADGWEEKVEALAPAAVEYRAFTGRIGDAGKDGKKEYIQVVTDAAAEFNRTWTTALMKSGAGKDGNGFAFNNVSDSVTKTYQRLVSLAAVDDTAEVSEDDDSPADELAEAEAV